MALTERLPFQPGNWQSLNEQFSALLTTVVEFTPPTATVGTATITNVAGIPIVSFPDAANGSAMWSTRLPAEWNTFDIVIWWTAPSGTGDVMWRPDAGFVGVGDVLTVTNGTGVATTLGTATLVQASTIKAGQAVTQNKEFSLRLFRLGSDGLDTLSGSAAAQLQLVRLVRVS